MDFAVYMSEELMMKNKVSKTVLVDCTVRKRTLVVTTIEKTVIFVPRSWIEWSSRSPFKLLKDLDRDPIE